MKMIRSVLKAGDLSTNSKIKIKDEMKVIE